MSSPVWFGVHHDRLYVVTHTDTGKVKRLRREPRAGVATCTRLPGRCNRVTSPTYPAVARLLDLAEETEARAAVLRQHRLQQRLFE